MARRRVCRPLAGAVVEAGATVRVRSPQPSARPTSIALTLPPATNCSMARSTCASGPHRWKVAWRALWPPAAPALAWETVELTEAVDEVDELELETAACVPDETPAGSLAGGRVVPLRLAPLQVAPVRSAPVKVALLRLASSSLAPVRVAPLRLAELRSARTRSAPVRSTPLRLAPARAAPVSVAPASVAWLRSAPAALTLSSRAPVAPILAR